MTGTATGTDRIPRPITGSYTTVTPVDQINTSISPDPGAVVGVAAPVIVSLGYAPADPALIESHLHITTTPHVDGAWAWIRHDGDTWPALDWRPKNYWPAGTQVHVESDIYGLDLAAATAAAPTPPATSPSATTRSCWPPRSPTRSSSSATARLSGLPRVIGNGDHHR